MEEQDAGTYTCQATYATIQEIEAQVDHMLSLSLSLSSDLCDNPGTERDIAEVSFCICRA